MKKVYVYLIAFLAIFFSFKTYAQPSGWAVDPSDYANSMTFTWQVSLPEGETVAENDFLAAFVDGECRGVVSAIELNNSGSYYFLLLVHSNNTVGDEISFKFYDASSEEVIEFSEKITFESEKIIGSFSDPNQFIVDPDIVLSTDNKEYSKMHLYPNPAKNQISLELRGLKNAKIKVVDMSGSKVLLPVNQEINEVTTLNISRFEPGLYFIIIDSPTHYSTSKFIKI